MQTMYRVAVACSTVLLLSSCAKSDKAAKDSAAAAAAAAAATPAPAPPPAAPAALALADVAGKWQVSAVPTTGKDTSATKYVLTATADTTGWLITFPSGVKSPLAVVASGDSIMLKSGEFASQRRKGLKVMTETVVKLENGKLVGVSTAHYQKAGPDSVMVLRTEGTRVP
jgi:hypothetical protein